jgi:hypothetical protein
MNELLRDTNLCAALHLAQSGLQTFLPGLSVEPREAASRLTLQLAIAVASSPCWMLIATPGAGRRQRQNRSVVSARDGNRETSQADGELDRVL